MTKKILLDNKQDLLILPSTPLEMPEASRYTAIPPAPGSDTQSLRDSGAWFLT